MQLLLPSKLLLLVQQPRRQERHHCCLLPAQACFDQQTHKQTPVDSGTQTRHDLMGRIAMSGSLRIPMIF